MDRKSTTKLLSRLIESHINPHNAPRIYWAKEVTFDYGTAHSVRVDYMRFKPVNNTVSGIEKGDFYCYEIKSSVEDFHCPNCNYSNGGDLEDINGERYNFCPRCGQPFVWRILKNKQRRN